MLITHPREPYAMRHRGCQDGALDEAVEWWTSEVKSKGLRLGRVEGQQVAVQTERQ